MTPSRLVVMVSVWVALLVWVYSVGWRSGYLRGYAKREADQKRWDCEWKWDLRPYKEIPGECLKYFNPIEKL